jgi:hypothetical protein
MKTKTFELSEELILQAIINLLLDGEKVTEATIKKSINNAIENVINNPELSPYPINIAEELLDRDGIDYSDIKIVYQNLLMAKRHKQFKKVFMTDSPTFASSFPG